MTYDEPAMKFVATSYRGGKEYSETVEAKDASEAKRICVLKGWTFEGELYMEIPADQTTQEEVQQMCDDLANGKQPLH